MRASTFNLHFYYDQHSRFSFVLCLIRTAEHHEVLHCGAGDDDFLASVGVAGLLLTDDHFAQELLSTVLNDTRRAVGATVHNLQFITI